MRIHNRQVLFSAATVMLVGCSGSGHTPSSDPLPSINTNDCAEDGTGCGGGSDGDSYGLTGRTLNGTTLDGTDLDGHGVLGVYYLGDASNGWPALLGLNGSTLVASHGNVIGMTLIGQVDNGSLLPLRITAATQGTDPDDEDITLYNVTYETTSGWLPFCGTDTTGAPVQAIALSGRWNYGVGIPGAGSHIDDPTSFTFACEGYALAKCTELGYKPWAAATSCNQYGCQSVSLAPTLEACSRAIRADYCGDGVSYTVDGTLIDIYDSFDIRSSSPGWPFEAEWTASGARCAVRERNPSLGTPPCWSSLQDPSCGSTSDWQKGALVMTQDSPPSP